MVPHLNPASTPHALDIRRSHPHKPLRVHMNGVLAGVERHTDSPIARVAALFHDLGKLNPNFQTKLGGTKPPGYDHHSYLSALAFLNYIARNPHLASLGLKREEMWAVLALIAHHHGSLPHLRAILNADESERLFNFMATQPDVAASPFLKQWLGHQTFEMGDADARKNWDFQNGIAGKALEKIERPLDFWLRTQFSFASLIESDKRDAGDNKRFRRDEQLDWARDNFSPALLQVLASHKTSEHAGKPINQVRTTIREEAVASLREKLGSDERVFTLTAPTGAGKTFILLALADEIRRSHPNHSVLYALPFLSITEQVEGVCRGVWSENPEFVTRLDSRAQNPALDDLLAQIETDPAASERLAQEHFSGQTFDGAFTITTFVQLFETLLSNRNATLLKLPNFKRTIFLLDEVQALPPRLYIFFAAYLREWCKHFDCYAILSTATMPHLEMVSQPGTPDKQQPKRLFPEYKRPEDLLDFEAHFQQDVFDRYRIEPRGELSAAQLADAVEAEEGSTLVILNTIADTRALYEELTKNRNMKGAHVILLNTHFILDDRSAKIQLCREMLKPEQKQRVILISTQLIEAGVDVDFSVVFRDLCPLPNLIQSAGRCNRNGLRERGRVFFFTLIGDKGKPRAELIYRHPSDKALLKHTTQALPEATDERDLLEVQREFFKRMAHNFAIGDHSLRVHDQRDEHANLIEYIGDFNFPVVGSFRLIDEREFGEEFRLYVPAGDEDTNWNEMQAIRADIADAFKRRASFNEMRPLNIALENQLRKMSGRVVAVRCERKVLPTVEPSRNELDDVCGLRRLAHPGADYSAETGLQLHTSDPSGVIL